MTHAADPRACDVLIVGAGPAGSAVATRLARTGLRVVVVERARFPRPKACAEYLSPGTVAALDRLGALDAVRGERPVTLRGMRIVSPDGTAFEGAFTTPGLAITRDRLDACLARGAVGAGAELLEGTCLEAIDDNGSNVRVLVRHGSSRHALRAQMVVGADGLNSRVARWLGVAHRSGRRQIALVAHVGGVTAMGDVGEMHVGDHGYVGLAPLGRGLTNVALVSELSAAGIPERPEAWLRRLLCRYPRVHDRVAGGTVCAPVRAVGPFGRTTSRASADRALLVGDAADFFDPFTGEGIYTALRGAALAAETIARAFERGRFDARLLACYDRARRRAFRAKWLVERMIGRVVGSPRMIDHVAHRLAARPEMADALVGVTGHSVPTSRVINPRFIWNLAF